VVLPLPASEYDPFPFPDIVEKEVESVEMKLRIVWLEGQNVAKARPIWLAPDSTLTSRIGIAHAHGFKVVLASSL